MKELTQFDLDDATRSAFSEVAELREKQHVDELRVDFLLPY